MTVHLSVRIDDEELGEQLLTLELDERDTLADLVTLTFADSSMLLADLLVEGQPVEVYLGHDSEHALVFRGIITAVRARYPQRGTPVVVVEALDSLIALSLQPHTRKWTTAPAQIVSEVAVGNHLTPGTVNVAAPEGEPRLEQQVEETDLAFLLRLARAYACKLYADHTEAADTLNFVTVRSLLSADPLDRPLVFNAGLTEFAPAFDVFATDPESVLVTTDPVTAADVRLDDKHIDGTEGLWFPDADRIAILGAEAGAVATLVARSAGRRSSATDVWRRRPRSAGAAARPSSDTAGQSGDRTRLLGQTATGRTAGDIWLRPRKRVSIKGYGGRWSGDWYLTRTRHVVDLARRDFTTSFRCTR